MSAHACDPKCPWCPRGLAAPALGVYDHRAPLDLRRHHRAAIEADVGPFVIVDFPHAGRTQVWAMLDAAKLDDGHSEWGPNMHALAAEWGAEVGERREWPDGRAYWTTRNVLTAETRMGSMPYSEPPPAAVAPVPAAPTAVEARVAALSVAVGRIGWGLEHVEVDAARGTARVEARRGSRIVYLYVDRTGRATLARWERGRVLVKTGRRGNPFLAERIEDRFIGRDSYRDPRAALQGLAAYLVDNGNGGALPGDLAALLALPSGSP